MQAVAKLLDRTTTRLSIFGETRSEGVVGA
jgi:hypothetical protein